MVFLGGINHVGHTDTLTRHFGFIQVESSTGMKWGTAAIDGVGGDQKKICKRSQLGPDLT